MRIAFILLCILLFVLPLRALAQPQIAATDEGVFFRSDGDDVCGFYDDASERVVTDYPLCALNDTVGAFAIGDDACTCTREASPFSRSITVQCTGGGPLETRATIVMPPVRQEPEPGFYLHPFLVASASSGAHVVLALSFQSNARNYDYLAVSHDSARTFALHPFELNAYPQVDVTPRGRVTAFALFDDEGILRSCTATVPSRGRLTRRCSREYERGAIARAHAGTGLEIDATGTVWRRGPRRVHVIDNWPRSLVVGDDATWLVDEDHLVRLDTLVHRLAEMPVSTLFVVDTRGRLLGGEPNALWRFEGERGWRQLVPR